MTDEQLSKFAEKLQQAFDTTAAPVEDDPAVALERDMQTLEVCVKEHGAQHADTADALNDVGTDLLALDEYEEALAYYYQSLEIRKALFGERQPETASSLSNIGGAYYQMGDKSRALTYGEQALATLRETRGDTHEDTLQVLANLAILLDDMHQSLRAYKLIDDALRSLPRDHAHYADLTNLRKDLCPPGFRPPSTSGATKKKKKR